MVWVGGGCGGVAVLVGWCVAWGLVCGMGCCCVGLVGCLELGLRGFVGWAALKRTWAELFRVVRVPWSDTRITRNNFGYRGLEPELVFEFFGFGLGFFGYGFWVSGILPTHRTVLAELLLFKFEPFI